MDYTYKTNKFKMPLFQGIVLTNTKQLIPAFYALIDNKQFEGFDWLIGCIE